MNYAETKVCAKCGESFPLDQFYKSAYSKDGKHRLCVTCERARVSRWITSKGEKEKFRRKMYAITRKYGLSLEEYKALLKHQNHKCAICSVDEVDAPNGTLCVDHDHTTGAVRGLLCHHCNAGLGHYKDSAALLENAAKYIKEKVPSTTLS